MLQPPPVVEGAVEHAVEEHAAEAFNAGEVIIGHVANSSIDHPLIHLPTVFGVDLSVTKHVLMLWLVAVTLFAVITWTVRRHMRRGDPAGTAPAGFMALIEFVVEFVRDTIVEPNVGRKWVNTWTPLILTFFLFILFANSAGLIPIFDVIGLLNTTLIHPAPDSFLAQVVHGGTTVTGNFNVTAALATIA